MAKYLFIGRYNPDGVKGVLAEGGTGRRGAAAELVASLGGKMEAFCYAFGEDDFYMMAELPGHAEAAAVSLAVGQSGAMVYRTVILLTAEEMDAAAKLKPTFRPPYTPHDPR